MDGVVSNDPVLARRARIARLAALGKRIGYLALGIAIVSFGAGVVTEFASWTVMVTTIGLVAACVILPIPIVLGYGVRAAARDERNASNHPPERR
jgi:ABC-type proline/glycine betaine transport system permease subunit